MTQAKPRKRRHVAASNVIPQPGHPSARILNRAFDDFGDRDPVEDYVEVFQRVRSEEMDW